MKLKKKIYIYIFFVLIEYNFSGTSLNQYLYEASHVLDRVI